MLAYNTGTYHHKIGWHRLIANIRMIKQDCELSVDSKEKIILNEKKQHISFNGTELFDTINYSEIEIERIEAAFENVDEHGEYPPRNTVTH